MYGFHYILLPNDLGVINNIKNKSFCSYRSEFSVCISIDSEHRDGDLTVEQRHVLSEHHPQVVAARRQRDVAHTCVARQPLPHNHGAVQVSVELVAISARNEI